ncbi:MAG: thioredoxin family protein [Acidobacteriota bacterium]|nr:thioredoxin family protein [Acidobacteriota bacterium]
MERKMELKPTTLRIYVAHHCESCGEALRLAEVIRQKHQTVIVEVIDLDAEGERNWDDVFSVPTWLLNGKVISLGNPSAEELEMRLS